MNKQLFLGNEPKHELMKPIENYMHTKGKGGLWTSTYNNGRSEWVEWCESEDFYTTDNLTGWVLTVNENARILTIDSYEDLEQAFSKYGLQKELAYGTHSLDYVKMSKDYDGMNLTSEGQWKTRLTYPLDLYAWDCESTHWFRWVFDKVECIGKLKLQFE